jgi:hypothetical protein
VNVKRYALGVVVSATCIVGGVLWYDRVLPSITGEDVAACIAAGVERKWVTDWVEPPTNTVTAWMRASDLEKAADLLRDALMNANVIYLDPDTWSDGGPDMSVGLAYAGQSWSLVTNYYVSYSGVTSYWLEVVAQTPESYFINGVSLADKYIPVTVVTSNFSIVTNQAYAIHTNLVIVAQTNTTGPNWADAGRTNGTVFRWNGSGYEDRETSYPDFPWDPIARDGYGWTTAHLWDYLWYWSTLTDSPVGTYYPLHLDGGQTGTVEIAWDDTYEVTPLITTTNMTLTYHGGTNMPLYAKLGMPPDYAAWGGLVDGASSWWEYADFGTDPYWLLDVEKPGGTLTAPVGTGRYTIETKNLAQLRQLATNMVRTVQFDFPVTGTNRVFIGDDGTNIYSAVDLDVAAGYAAIPGMIVGTVATSAITSIIGEMASEDSQIQTIDEVWAFTEPDFSTNPAVTRHLYSIVTNQAYAEHTNLYIKSQYMAADASPNWSDTGRTNGTVFTWTNNAYFNVPDDLEEGASWSGIDEDGTQYIPSSCGETWATTNGNPYVGIYKRVWVPDCGGDFTSSWVEIDWHDSVVIDPIITTTNYVWSYPWTRAWGLGFRNSNLAFRQTAIPIEAFTNGYIARMRVYVAAETRSPYTYPARTNYVSSSESYTFAPLLYGENKGQTYGWDINFGATTEDQLPTQIEAPEPKAISDAHYGYRAEVGYLTTNYVWSLVYDETNPTTNPVITIGADPFVDSSYFSTEPPLSYTVDDWDHIVSVEDAQMKEYARLCSTRIVHSALVIDWNFRLFGAAPYVPIETNKPAWLP